MYVACVCIKALYKNHQVQVRQQMARLPRAMPTLEMPAFENIAELLETTTSDYKLLDYDPMDSIKAPMAV